MNIYSDGVTMNKTDGYMELTKLTTGTASAMVVMTSQMRLLRTGNGPVVNIMTGEKHQQSHLTPHKVSHTMHATFVEAQADQANEHNKK
jgi:hypothetical protein